jgi:ABC-type multidrug transport system ATPase subunit
LAGVVTPRTGKLVVNGQAPSHIKDLAAGYISAEETEPLTETVHEILSAFGTTHGIKNVPARIGELSAALELTPFLHLPAGRLSTAQRLRVNIARAALSDSPVILLDDVADALGVKLVSDIIATLFQGRTCIVSTRFVGTAEALNLPILLLHGGSLAHTGTCDEIANTLACPRRLDVWVEGLRYDLLRKLRQHPGVGDVRLLPSSRFSGQKLRIQLHSARYLPSIYDLISQAPLVRVQELPASLADIIARLS